VPEDLPLEPTFHFKRPPTNRIYAITPRAYREQRDRLFPMIVKAAREFLPATGKARQAVHHVPDIGRMTLDQVFRKAALDHILTGEGDWPGEDLPSMDMGDFDRIASQFKKEELQVYLSLVRTLMLQLDVRPGDERTALSCAMEDRLSFTIGNRYTLVLSNGKQRYWFLSSEFADDPRIVNDSFKGSPVARHLSTNEPEALFGQWPHVLTGARRELERTNSSKYRKYNHPRFMAAVEAAEPLEHLMNEQPRAAVNEPLNLILYGPPGTGKTYTLKNEFFDRFTTRVERLTREQRLTELVEELTWWQVVAMVLLDLGPSKASAIMEHELLRTKARLSSSANIRATVWGTLQTHTVLECPLVAYKGRLEPLLFNKQENSIWEVLPNLMDELAPELRGLLEQSKHADQGDAREVKRYEFVTFHQSFSYEDFVEGIKPHLGETDDIGYEVKDGVFKRICAKAEQDPENDYALFIDEINRGNVASIFGELITLLEDDKRLRRPQALTTTLPYSKKTFGVPPNLYVIGTMNTADRSVEALDTALRRRFSFREMPARPDLLNGQELGGVDLQRLLSTINERVEQLLDKDHHIGHSYFMSISSGVDLKRVFANKVLPLLEEYFQGCPQGGRGPGQGVRGAEGEHHAPGHRLRPGRVRDPDPLCGERSDAVL